MKYVLFACLIFALLSVYTPTAPKEKPLTEQTNAADYGYILKDINNDGVPELFWVRDDYSLLAAFTISEGKAVTIGAYSSRNKGFVMDTGEIYQYAAGGSELTLIKTVGNYRDENYYEIVDGQKHAISKDKFDNYKQLYFPAAVPADQWKMNEIIRVAQGTESRVN